MTRHGERAAGHPPTAREPLVLLALTVLALMVSGIDPYERGTWWMEVFPVLLAVPVLLVTYRRFPLTRLPTG